MKPSHNSFQGATCAYASSSRGQFDCCCFAEHGLARCKGARGDLIWTKELAEQDPKQASLSSGDIKSSTT